MALFETLLQIDSDLTDWMIHASPTTDGQHTAMRRVFALRADLEQHLNTLVAYRLQIAAADFSGEASDLNAAAARIKQVDKTIDTVQEVLSVADTTVSIADKILAVVA